MHASLLAATDNHWCDAAIALQLVGGLISVTLRAERCDQPRSQHRSGSREGIHQGMLTCQPGDLHIIALDGLQKGSGQARPSAPGDAAGCDARLVVGRRHSLSDLLEPLANALPIPAVMVDKETLDRGGSRALQDFQARPAYQE